MSKYNITNGKNKAILKLFLNLRTIQEERSEKKNWKEYTVGDSPQTDSEQDKIDPEQDKIRDDGKYYYNIRTKQIKYERPEIMKTTYQEYEYIETIAETQIISFIENLNFDELEVISKTIQKEVDKEEEENFVSKLETRLKTQLETQRKIKANDSRKEKEEKEEKPKKEEPPTIYFQKSNNIIGINRELKPGEVWESLGNGMFSGKKWEKVFTKQVSDVTAEKVMVNEGHIRLRNEDAISNDKNAISNELNIDREIRRNLQIVQQKIYKLDTQKNDGKKRLEDIQKRIWEEMQRILKPGTQIKLGKGTEGDISKKVAKLLGDTHWNLFRPRLDKKLSEQELLQLKRMINYVNPELLIAKDKQTKEIVKIKKGFQISSSGVAHATTQHSRQQYTSVQIETEEGSLGTTRTVVLEEPKTQGTLEQKHRERPEQEQQGTLEQAARKQAARKQAVREQAAREQAAREQADEDARQKIAATNEQAARRRLFYSKLNQASLTQGMDFPYFDIDEEEFFEEVQIVESQYNEKEELKLSLDANFYQIADIDYVIAGVLEGRIIKQNLELFNFEFEKANREQNANLQLNEPFPYLDEEFGFFETVKLTGKHYSTREQKWKLLLNFYDETNKITKENVVEDIADVIKGKKKGSEIEQQKEEERQELEEQERQERLRETLERQERLRQEQQKEEFLEEVNENALQIGAEVSFVVGDETLKGKVDDFVWDEEQWKLVLVEYGDDTVEYKSEIYKVLNERRRQELEEQERRERRELEEQERRDRRQTRFDSKLNAADLTLGMPFPYLDLGDKVFVEEVQIIDSKYDEKKQKWKLKLSLDADFDTFEDIDYVIAGVLEGRIIKQNLELFNFEFEKANREQNANLQLNEPFPYLDEEFGFFETVKLTGKHYSTREQKWKLLLTFYDEEGYIIEEDVVKDIANVIEGKKNGSEIEQQKEEFPWDDEPEYKEQDRDDSILSDNDSEVEIVDEQKLDDILRRGADESAELISSDDEEVEIVDDALPDGAIDRVKPEWDEKRLNEEGYVPLQKVPGGGIQYDAYPFVYVGEVERFEGRTGIFKWMKFSPEENIRYTPPGELLSVGIRWIVKWDNEQNIVGDKDFTFDEAFELFENLKETGAIMVGAMLPKPKAKTKRRRKKNRLIPIDELNFQKEMYNKDTSTLVVAEASASKPGLSPASIPSGELSAMLAELSSMDNTESEYASQSEYASESEVEEPLETGWKSDDFASSDFASESGDNSSELSN